MVDRVFKYWLCIDHSKLCLLTGPLLHHCVVHSSKFLLLKLRAVLGFDSYLKILLKNGLWLGLNNEGPWKALSLSVIKNFNCLSSTIQMLSS